jgi:radical SAM superfamily enzyme YgiQ (UPF0313 family)
MKIKLIVAASRNDPLRKNDPFMPLSLPILAAVAPEHEYGFVDLLWEDDVRYEEPVDLVGISVRYSAENRAYEIADRFRQRGVKVILGGPHPSAVPFDAIRHADAVAVGEAEELWPVIVSDAGNDRLKSFYVCSPRKFEPGPYSMHKVDSYPDLQKNAAPMRGLYRKKYVFDTVFAVRGCPVNCDFCAVTGMFGARYRMKPVADVVAEIRTFRGYYYLLDDSVFGKPETYGYYLKLYEAVSCLGKRRYWTGQANLDAASENRGRRVIAKAAGAGLLYAAVGMESVNPGTLARSGAIRKMGAIRGKDAIPAMKENIRFIQEQGIIISGWFVVGYEDDDIETFYRTWEFCREMNVIPVIFPVRAIPGTRLYERLRKKGLIDDARILNFRHPKMTDEKISAALEETGDEGFSWREIMRRTRFYASRFGDDRIHKIIFSIVLQSKMRAGIGIARDGFTLSCSGR